MKKIFLFSALMLVYYCSNAQTNTFPSSGNVGVGTTSPINLLHITGNLGAADILRLSTTDATDGRSTILFTSAKGSQTWQFGQNPGGSSGLFGLRDMTAGGFPIRFVVNTSGYFGIGTIAPAAPLNVVGTETIRITGTGTSGVSSIGYMSFYDSNNTQRYGFLGDASNVNSDLYFTSDVGGLNFGAGGVNGRMYISSSGNVGIGDLNPAYKLSVNSQGNTGSASVLFHGQYYGTTITSEQSTPTYYALNVKGGTTSTGGSGSSLFYVRTDGNVGIGTTMPDQKLSVNGTIHSKSVLVDLNGWSDYVFKKDYPLLSLGEVKAYIDQNQHLPGVPSEQEMIKNGLNVSEMNKLLTKKVEELTLYIIQENKDKTALKEELSNQQNANQAIERRLDTQAEEIKTLKLQLRAILKSNKIN